MGCVVNECSPSSSSLHIFVAFDICSIILNGVRASFHLWFFTFSQASSVTRASGRSSRASGVAASGLKPTVWPSYQCSTVQSQPTASCLLPPSLRRESGEPGLVCVCGCLSFWQNTLPRETSPLSLRLLVCLSFFLFLFECVVVCFSALADILTTTGGFFVGFFLVVTKRRVLRIPPGDNEPQKHRETQNTVWYDEYSQLLRLFSAAAHACTFSPDFGDIIRRES